MVFVASLRFNILLILQISLSAKNGDDSSKRKRDIAEVEEC